MLERGFRLRVLEELCDVGLVVELGLGLGNRCGGEREADGGEGGFGYAQIGDRDEEIELSWKGGFDLEERGDGWDRRLRGEGGRLRGERVSYKRGRERNG